MTDPAARPLDVRKQDTLRRLTEDIDAWIATASPDGTAYLMPLSFLWTNGTLLMSTTATNPTARNLEQNPEFQLTLGHTRDVIHITATCERVDPADVPPEEAEAFAVKAGFDPRPLANYPFYRATPTKIQAWREVNELKTRTLMDAGLWLV
jgi:Pyridoxamine 5'-phosphate oxidase